MEEYIRLREENAVLEHELDTILNLIFEGIETESYINPFGIFSYLKAVYPNRYGKRMRVIHEQDE